MVVYKGKILNLRRGLNLKEKFDGKINRVINGPAYETMGVVFVD